MKKIFFTLFILVKIVFISFGQKTEQIFLDKNDKTSKYYVQITPEKDIKGTIVLIPGYGETPETVIIETKIDETASSNGYLVIIPYFNNQATYFEKEYLSFVESVLDNAANKNGKANKNLIMGGFSNGGAVAMLYTEKHLSQYKTHESPIALFMVDSPLDSERFIFAEQKLAIYKGLDVYMDKDHNAIANFVYKALNIFGEDYKSNPEFWKYSPYVRSDLTFKNIKPLVNLPVRFYSEFDIYYWYEKDKEGNHLWFANLLDGGSLIKDLHFLGNQDAELILTKDKGFRETGKYKAAHSWSIVDAEELVNWADKIIANRK